MTMVHPVGGAPGRGTELGSLQVQNSIAVRRSVFVNGQKCMLAPTYCKTRSVKSVVEPLVRYLDENSSKHLKLFLVVIQAWMVVRHSETRTLFAANKSLGGGRVARMSDLGGAGEIADEFQLFMREARRTQKIVEDAGTNHK